MGGMTPPRFRLVIALDRTELAEIVVEHALDQAVRHDSPDIHFLTVVHAPDEIDAAKEWLATIVLEGLGAFRGDRPDWRTRLHVRTGKVGEQIIELAEEVDADLLVIGRFGSHDARGSLAPAIVDLTSCPTLVVGLSGRALDLETCADCAHEREVSEGERWFCAAHAGDRVGVSLLVTAPAV